MSRIAIVGAGAMGGLWAGKLVQAGHDVTIVDVSRELIEAVRRDGLIVLEEGVTEQTSRVAATNDPRDAGEQDVVFVFVKGYHTRAAARGLGPLLDDETVVVTLQNGWGNADVLAEHVPGERLVVGVTYHSAMVEAPGRIRHPGAGPSYVGPYRDGDSLEHAERVAALMTGAGLEAEATAEVKTAIWRKLIHNAACLPVSALTDLHAAPLVEPGPVRDLIDDLAREAVAVAVASGYAIDEDERIERIHAVLGAAGMGVPSMLADVHARRQTEIDTINGAVARAAGRVGVEVPLNAAMVALIAGLERAWGQATDV
jgi:2-dehydropantoate 2-reductase